MQNTPGLLVSVHWPGFIPAHACLAAYLSSAFHARVCAGVCVYVQLSVPIFALKRLSSSGAACEIAQLVGDLTCFVEGASAPCQHLK
eukprot:1307636-Pleurochrysis_carterae.AAC.3